MVAAVAALGLGACGGDADEALIDELCEFDVGCFPERWAGDKECVAEFSRLLDVADEVSTECGDAVRDVYDCVVSLETCEELDEYWTEPTPDYPCSERDAAAQAACEE